MVAMKTWIPLLAALLALSCSNTLELPPEPAGGGELSIASFEPAAAFAGERVNLTLNRAPGDDEAAKVLFGVSASAPLEHDDAGYFVRIPETATDAALSILTIRSLTTTAATFRMRGYGRLRHQRLEREHEASLGPYPLAVLAYGSYTVLAIDTPPGLALYRAGRVTFHRDLAGLHPTLVRSSRDQKHLIVAGLSDGSAGCAAGSLAILPLTLDSLDSGTLTKGPLACLGPADHVSVAANDTGTRAIVILAHGDTFSAWGIELGTGATRALELSGRPMGDMAAYLAGPGFLLAEGGGLRAFKDDGSWAASTWTDRVPGLASTDDLLSIGTHAGRSRIIVGTSEGRVFILDGHTWPPAADTLIPAGFTARGPGSAITSVGFLNDGLGLFTVQPALPAVRMISFAGPIPEAMAGFEISSPLEAIPVPDGTLRISGENEAVVVSQRTGAFIESVPLTRRLSFPTFLRSPCDGTSALAVLSNRLGFVEQRSPQSLTLEPCTFAAESPAGGGDVVRELAGHPDSDHVFVVYESGRLGRERPRRGEQDGGAVVIHDTLRLPAPADTPSGWKRRSLSLGISGALVPQGTLAIEDPARGKVLVLDALADDFATRTPFELDAGNELVRALVDEERIVIVQRRNVLVFDASEARLGKARVLGTFALDHDALAASSAHGVLLVAGHDPSGPMLDAYALTGTVGTPLVKDLPIEWGFDLADVQLSAAGTEGYVLLNGGDGGGWLQVVSIDATPTSLLLPIGGSEGRLFTHLAVSGSGERVVAVDAQRNVIAAFE